MPKREPRPCGKCKHDVVCHLSTTPFKVTLECGCEMRITHPLRLLAPICSKFVKVYR